MDLRKYARGKNCTAMIDGVCNGNTETTVLAHLNGAGMGMKQPDVLACFACSSCHWWLDGGYSKKHTREKRDFEHLKAIVRTQKILIQDGILKW